MTPANTAPADRTSPAGRDRIAKRRVVAATSLGFAVIQLDVSVVNVAIKPIGVSLGGGVAALQWVVDAYTVAFAALILTAGAIGDRDGAKRLYIAGFAIFTVASVGCGLAPDIGTLVAGRAVQGAGAAVLGACSLSLLNHAHRVRGTGGRTPPAHAAAAAVRLGHVRRRGHDRAARQHRLLRARLRVQPVLPARAALLAVGDGPGVRPDDGRDHGGQPRHRPARHRAR